MKKTKQNTVITIRVLERGEHSISEEAFRKTIEKNKHLHIISIKREEM